MFWKKFSRKIHPKDQNTADKVDFKTTIIEDEDLSDHHHPGQEYKPKFLFHGNNHQSEPHHEIINFNDIVDQEERGLEDKFSHVFVGWMIDLLPFRMFMLVAILLNSIVIGIQTNKYLEQNFGGLFLALDSFFLTIFALEILVKWYHDFLGFWKVGWNIFDFIIVAASLLGPSLTFLSGSRVLRILRVLRALRSLRSISALRGLQIVVQTVIHSIPDMANIVALLLICMFIFAILGYSFFGDNCPNHFGSLGTSMFSLFICVTQDGWMGITEELNQCGNSILGAIYLLIFITIGAFIFANLVVAVVVTNLEWAIAEQKELEEKTKATKPSTVDQNENIVTVDSKDFLTKLARHQEPLLIPEFHLNTSALEEYFLVISAMEDNLVEFKKLQVQLTEIQQEIKALATLDDVSDDEVFELSTMTGVSRTSSSTRSRAPSSSQHRLSVTSEMMQPRRRRFHSLAGGDAVSSLMAMNRRNPVAPSRAKSIHHIITHLATTQHHHHHHHHLHHRPSLTPSFLSVRHTHHGDHHGDQDQPSLKEETSE